MSFSFDGLRIFLALLALCCVLFFFNRRPKFLVPFRYLKQRSWWIYNILSRLLIISVLLLPLRISIVSDRQVVAQKNLPIQIILDVSLSMAANDIQPSRFVAAKAALISLIEHMDGYYISLITFSGKPFVSIPFSSSSSAIIAKLQHMNLGDFPPVKEFLGTALGDALLLGVSNLQQFSHNDTYKPGIVILITDGDSNIGFDPTQVISYYQKTQVPLFILGVGQENFLIGRDSRNDEVTTDINIALQQQLAQQAGGKFYRVLSGTSFEYFFDELSQNIVTQQQQKIQNTFWELNNYLIYFIVVSLLGNMVYRLFLLLRYGKIS